MLAAEVALHVQLASAVHTPPNHQIPSRRAVVSEERLGAQNDFPQPSQSTSPQRSGGCSREAKTAYSRLESPIVVSPPCPGRTSVWSGREESRSVIEAML